MTVPIPVDSEKMQQIFQNLFDNGWRYTPTGGRFSISIERSAGMLKVIFANMGEAIAAEHLPLIFERFYRIDSARSAAPE